MGVLHEQDAQRKSIGKSRARYLTHTDNLMMVVIDFEDGPSAEPDPPHSHPHEQVSYVAAGRIIVFIGEESRELEQGDMFTVPPNIPHSIQLLTSKVRLVDTFTPLREDFLDK